MCVVFYFASVLVFTVLDRNYTADFQCSMHQERKRMSPYDKKDLDGPFAVFSGLFSSSCLFQVSWASAAKSESKDRCESSIKIMPALLRFILLRLPNSTLARHQIRQVVHLLLSLQKKSFIL